MEERFPAAPPTALSATSSAMGASSQPSPRRAAEHVDSVDEAVGAGDRLQLGSATSRAAVPPI